VRVCVSVRVHLFSNVRLCSTLILGCECARERLYARENYWVCLGFLDRHVCRQRQYPSSPPCHILHPAHPHPLPLAREQKKAKAGNEHAKTVLKSWAEAEWFLSKPDVPDKITTTVFFVKGETNTDDLSPAPDAWSRPDIPLHGLAMLKIAREGIIPDQVSTSTD